MHRQVGDSSYAGARHNVNGPFFDRLGDAGHVPSKLHKPTPSIHKPHLLNCAARDFQEPRTGDENR